MLARTPKSLMLINHFQLMMAGSTIVGGTGVGSLRPAFGMTPFQMLSQQPSLRSLASDGQAPKKPPPPPVIDARTSDPEIVTKKFFVIEPSKSEPSVQKCASLPATETETPCEAAAAQPKLFVVDSTAKVVPKTSGSCSSVNTLPPKPRLERCSSASTVHIDRPQGSDVALKDRAVAMLGAVFDARNVARAQHAFKVTWDASVRTGQNVVYWCRVFLDSREFFYMQYYTLLVLEYAVHYVRTGLELLARKVRGAPSKSN